MSSDPDAAIVAIGAVRFSLEKREVYDKEPNGTFYATVSLESSVRAGGKMNPSTVLWWMQQEDAARRELTSDQNLLIEEALKNFAAWVRATPALSGVWGNGVDFDNVILIGAYKRLNWTQPWSYKLNRCFRTLRGFGGDAPYERVGVAHNALDDAITQAKHLCRILDKRNLTYV